MRLPVFVDDRLQLLLRPEFRSADFSQAGGVPIEACARRRLAGLYRLRDRRDVVRLGIDVHRRRHVFHDREDCRGVRPRPAGAAIAAPGAVVHQLSVRNIPLVVRIGAVRIFQTALPPQQDGRMPADGALSGVCGVALPFELQERAEQRHPFPSRAVVAFERRLDLCRHIGAACRQLRPFRIAEVLGAANAVREIRAAQLAAVTVPRRNRAKRPAGFADDVEPAPEAGGARRVHGEVAGIRDLAFGHLFQVKRARPAQNHRRNSTVAVTDMGPQPGWNVGRLLRGKGAGQARHGHGDGGEADDGGDV